MTSRLSPLIFYDRSMNLETLKDSLEYKDGNLYWKIQGNNQFVYPGALAGVPDNSGYSRFVYQGKRYLTHRIIFFLCHGYLPKYVDHINRNQLDNRIENLREATAQENAFNRRASRTKKGNLPKGIFQRSSGNYFVAFRFNGILKRFGTYKTLEEAINCANQVQEQYHGEFKYG